MINTDGIKALLFDQFGFCYTENVILFRIYIHEYFYISFMVTIPESENFSCDFFLVVLKFF